MIAYPGVHTLDVVGPLEILATTAYFAPDGPPPYDIAIVAESAGPVTASSGLTVTASLSFKDVLNDLTDVDTLMIAGGHGTSQALKDRALLEFLKIVAPKARRVASICTGALVLAEAGLLEGKRASTHWFWCPKLESGYPGVEVDRDAIYVRDGNIWTSAGVTSGMDLALALVEDDLGHEAALQVARFSVMYMMRSGGQSQFSAHLVAQRADDPAINATLELILAHPGDPLTVTSLAARAGLSERTFARRFKNETGLTPAAYVETARVQAARIALETSAEGVEQIAISAGFTNAERMRRAFQRHLGISASEYRDRFRRIPDPQALIRDGPQ
ncbi:helix-turn-helix domain-containing protein [Alphaproteobacteria bacterium GH1-50]|uniref:Helix-turn-helix domain-containing protein n=1 Tax=Kangsaoukella pontilimi TaxID=2691042 RepID=A0A7C9MCV8_9RHOB|nr:GlxA family transcriptional regulator [Kangsaoukella pontilimi]MXQ07372.1 helix-turn-helix domain-containing protein [Kangsaoukella pontilimi]